MTIWIFIGFTAFSRIALASTMTFDELKDLPNQWMSGSYYQQGSPHWEIKKEASAPSQPNALMQTGKAPYMWIVDKNTSFRDGSIEVDYSILSGKEDPEAGVIWRFQDGENYYYVRANAVKENIVFYRMLKGQKQLLKEAEIKTPYKSWHKIRIETNSEELKVYFDKKLVLNTRDKTFLQPGFIGLFTTADTVCAFDNLKVDASK
jgi:hypothetical protein